MKLADLNRLSEQEKERERDVPGSNLVYAQIASIFGSKWIWLKKTQSGGGEDEDEARVSTNDTTGKQVRTSCSDDQGGPKKGRKGDEPQKGNVEQAELVGKCRPIATESIAKDWMIFVIEDSRVIS